MNGESARESFQANAVLAEYERAVIDGAERKALNIRQNPDNKDLVSQFERIDRQNAVTQPV